MIKIINETTLEIDGINYTNFDKAIVNEISLLLNELIKYNKVFKDLLETNNDYFKRLSDALEYINGWIEFSITDDDITGMNKLKQILKGDKNE